MRRTDREVKDRNEVLDILNRCETVRIAMRGERYPYVVPVSFGMEEADGQTVLYFHCAKEGRKLDLLKADPSVCVEADLYTRAERTEKGITYRYESVIGFGECSFVSDPDEAMHGLRVLLAHYNALDFPVETCGALTHVFIGKIVLHEITGKRNLPGSGIPLKPAGAGTD